MNKKKMIFLCQQILSDANRAQYNRAWFLTNRYSLYIIANKGVSSDVRTRSKSFYSFSINQKAGRALFPFWYLWVLLKIKRSNKDIKHIYSTYEPRNIIFALFAKMVFKLNWTLALWDEPEKA